MAYWCAEQIVVTVEGPAGRTVVSVPQPFARVGSHPYADVVIADAALARRCLYLHATTEGVYCLYLDVPAADIANQNSQENGTWLLPDQDVIVGDYRVRASLHSAEGGNPLPDDSLATWGSAPPPLPVLLVYSGGLLKDKRKFRARLSPVGRRPQCGLQLKGKKVSSFHCVLYWDREQLWCVDLNSSNGTTLNGVPMVASRIGVGDRLDVGEFGLVFQRLSSGGGQRLSDSGSQVRAADEQPVSQDLSLGAPPLVANTSNSLEPTAVIAAPSLHEEERQLRARLAEEVARLGREQQALEQSRDQWTDERAELTRQLGERSDELAWLKAELTAATSSLEKSRQDWQAERESLIEQLTARTQQLAKLEAELAATTASWTKKLAEVEERSRIPEQPPAASAQPNLPPHDPSQPLDELLLAQVAPAAVVTGIEPDLAAGLATNIASEVTWNFIADDPADMLPPQPDPQIELQTRWEETNERLSAQVEQLRAETTQLAAERLALAQSRDEWRAERAMATEQLAQRQQELTRQQAELTAAASSLAAKLNDVEQRIGQSAAPPLSLPPTPVAPERQSAKPIPEPPPDKDSSESTDPGLDPGPIEQRISLFPAIAPPEQLPLAPPDDEVELSDEMIIEERADLLDNEILGNEILDEETQDEGGIAVVGQLPDRDADDRDELVQFVTDRLSEKNEPRALRWLWWSAGGIGVAALLAVIVIVVMWAF